MNNGALPIDGVTVDDVTVTYNNGHIALHDASFELVRGAPDLAPLFAVLPGGDAIVIATREGAVLRWAATTSGAAWATTVGTARSLAVSRSGDVVAAHLMSGAVAVLDAGSGRVISTLPCQPGGILGVALSEDGLALAALGADGTVRIAETATAAIVSTHPFASRCPASLAWLGDGRLAAVHDDGRVEIIDGAAGRTP